MARRNRNEENGTNDNIEADETSIPRAKMSEMKKLILTVYTEFKDIGSISSDTQAELARIVPILGSVRGGGVSLEAQLAQVNEELAAHLQAAPVIDGKVSTTDEWENDYRILLNRKMRIGKALGDAADADTE